MQPERVVVLVLVVVLVTLGAAFARYSLRARAGRLMASPSGPLWDALGTLPDGRPTIVAFSSPSCAACHTAQRPAVRAVQHQLGPTELRVLEVDVAAQPEVARRFGILTVPSTVILTAEGAVTAVNHGFTPTARLLGQL